jgi:8-oxo-dGTP pyrophosphatase MutT (NUDIX family)
LIDSDLVRHAVEAAKQAGADAADAIQLASDSVEARVRGNEIDYVKQARERALGLRAFVRGKRGLATAVVSTSDLSHAAIRGLAEDAVALARATAEDPDAGLPSDGFASDWPELELHDPRDRTVALDDHRSVKRDVVIHPGAVGIVAVDAEVNVHVLRQYRHPVAAELWEIPAGLLDDPGETPWATAQRELVEEAGLRADAPPQASAASPGDRSLRSMSPLAYQPTIERLNRCRHESDRRLCVAVDASSSFADKPPKADEVRAEC